MAEHQAQRDSSFGERLRGHRLLAGLTQQELAERAGLSPRGISDLERGIKTTPRSDTLRLLIRALELRGSDARAFREAARAPKLHAGEAAWFQRSGSAPRQIGSGFTRPTPLVGRTSEAALILGWLRSREVRLLTLTGTGGVGKTRLALAVTDTLGRELVDETACIDLSSVKEPELVIPTIARTLGIGDAAQTSPRDQLIESLQGRRLLLVVDNFEQVLPAATDLDILLECCFDLVVLVTSREPLRVRREHVYPVPPLALPDAVQLFVQRAVAVQPAFLVTDDNAPAIETICRRLDCLPLAIELAAARSAVLDPDSMNARLSDRLALLRDGPRDAPMRQRGLAATLAWSHDLLTPLEQALFRGLGAFSGGFSLDSATAVATSSIAPAELLDVLTSLVNKNLVNVSGDRFALLETVREYAAARLADDPVVEHQTQQRHAQFFLKLAEQADAQLHGSSQNVWLARMEKEHDNLRAALDRTIATRSSSIALSLVGALSWFWYVHTFLDEGCKWAERALSLEPVDDDARIRARAMIGAALLHENRGQYSTAEGLLTNALPLARHASDQALVGWCSIVQGLVARDQGQYEAARRLLEDGISIVRLNGAPWMVEVGLLWLASVERYTGNHALAMQLFNQSLEIGRALEDRLVTARVLAHLSGMFSEAGNAARAQALAEECRMIGREAGSRWTEGIGLIPLAIALTEQVRLDDAETVLRDVFQVFRDIGDGARVAYALHTLAHVAQAKGEHMRSALLLGAARAVRRRQGEAQMTGLVPPGSLNPSREALGERAFDEAVQAGDQLTASEIAALVLG